MTTSLFDPVRGVSEPDRTWTLTNAAEATSDILSPLCWSVWEDPLDRSFRAVMAEWGILAKSEVVVSPDPNHHMTGAIYGRQAFNIDALRPIMARIPGIDVDAFERDLMGTVRTGLPKAKSKPWRLPIVLAKMPKTMLGASKRLHRIHTEARHWWQTEVFDVSAGARPPAGEPIDDLKKAAEWFERTFTVHVIIRLQMQSVQGAITKAAVKAGDAALGTAALCGQGGVAETKLADDAWRLGRGEITEREFLAEYGYHGPNEGNVYTRSWREQPERVRGIAKAHGGRQDSVRPRDREKAAIQAGRDAAERLLAAVPASQRAGLRFMLARARNIIPNVQTGKAGYLMALDGCRAAARRLGAQQVERGRFDEVDDVFFLTIPELERLVAGDLDEARELIKFRRAAREEYAAVELPVNFTGMPTPIARSAPVEPATGAVQIIGVASGGGTAEGRARVVLDPNGDVELDDGDILVCRFTDPSWAPLFTLAEALVIDIGGSASHGAVVAREMGVPYVIGTGNGTQLIRDGDRIHVDGTANLVRVLS